MAKKSENSNKKGDRNVRPHRVLYVIVVAIVVLLSVPWLFYFKGVANVNNTQNDMREYLQNKYKQDFRVSELSLNGSGLGVKGVWHGKAHPVDDRSMEFGVSKSESSGVISDSYINKVWSMEETDSISLSIKRIIPSAVRIRIKVGIDPGLLETLHNPLKSYKVARKQNQDSLSYTLVVVVGKRSDNIAEQLFKSTQQLKESGLKKVSVLYAEKIDSEKMQGQSCDADESSSVANISKCINNKVEISSEEV